MESFSLLKYWRGGGGGGATVAAAIRSSTAAGAAPDSTADTFAAAVIRPSSGTTDDGEEDHDEGPFFDLEFAALPADEGSPAASQGEVEEGELNFELSSVAASRGGGGGDEGVRAEGFVPSDDLFFKGKLVPLESSSSIVIAASDSDSKPHFPAVSLLKSATKFRVFLPGLRKHKPAAAETNGAAAAAAETNGAAAAAAVAAASPKQPPQQQNRFFVKFKVEEVPIVSLFTRDNSARNSSSNRASKPPAEDTATAATAEAEEKRFAREARQKYLNMIKPLYVRASRKHGEKPKHLEEPAPPKAAPGEAEPEEAAPAPAPSASAGGGKGGLVPGVRVVGKRLGKSWSASAAVAAVPTPAPPPQRRDDSLLEQQDGIQSAIAHCKRSFTAAEKGSESPLARSKSEPIRSSAD